MKDAARAKVLSFDSEEKLRECRRKLRESYPQIPSDLDENRAVAILDGWLTAMTDASREDGLGPLDLLTFGTVAKLMIENTVDAYLIAADLPPRSKA